MNAEQKQQAEVLKRLLTLEHDIVKKIQDKDDRIKTLQQENEDLKGQLRQFGLDNNKPKPRGLFLHD